MFASAFECFALFVVSARVRVEVVIHPMRAVHIEIEFVDQSLL